MSDNNGIKLKINVKRSLENPSNSAKLNSTRLNKSGPKKKKKNHKGAPAAFYSPENATQ